MRTTSVILAVVAVALGLTASVEAANTPTSGGGASSGCGWFSDFDGALASSTHFVITPSGRMVGWATY